MSQKMIQIQEGFQTSVNIAYDLHDKNKIMQFIPTMSAIDILEDILLSLNPTSTQRARILVGAYGRGKSHIILTLLSLLYHKDGSLLTALLEKIRNYNVDLYDYVQNYLASDTRILPVVISGSSTSLTQSFMLALQQTLERESLSDVMPDTHYEAAVKAIENWKQQYAVTFEQFVNALDEPFDAYMEKLHNFDIASYNKFVSLYPQLTAGSAFNPFVGFDVVEIYEQVNKKLSERGFGGLFVVYDEFSKYLESSISTASIGDIKLLQDFAEKCNRSGKLQMQLLLICHKDISNYIDSRLSKDKVDGWRGVSGRFKHIELQNNFSQMYEIISSVILKNDNLWNTFVDKHKATFDELCYRMRDARIFNADSLEGIRTIVYGCYPLHPVSVFVLPRLSEKVAQNERTLFTFLSAKEKKSLYEHLVSHNEGDFALLSADVIYDYFEPLLRKETYTSDTHKIYKLTTSALRKLEENSLEAKIVKFIALVYVVAQFEKLPPTVDMVVEAFRDVVGDTKEIHEALENLIKKDCIVYLKRSNGFLKIKESSGVDIPLEINKKISELHTRLSLTEILNGCSFNSYVYPTRYNDTHDIVRYFDFTFVSAKDILGDFSFESLLSNTAADGVVLGVLPDSNTELLQIHKKAAVLTKQNKQVVLVVPKEFSDIAALSYEYKAACELKDLAAGDDLLEDEYNVYIEDLSEVVSDYINTYVSPEQHRSTYYSCGKKVELYRRAQFTAFLSDICEEVFYRTPIINNESINKNVISNVAINSREKLLNAMLEPVAESNLGLTGSGQEVSFMRSLLVRTGLVSNLETQPVFNKHSSDEKIDYVLQTIRSFFEVVAKEGTTTFQVLYEQLCSPQYSIGLKKGVIPVFLTVVIKELQKSITILYGQSELKLSGELLSRINDAPDKYSVRVDAWTKEKDEYIEGLASIFTDYMTERTVSFANLANILSAMGRWYLSLPKYSKELKQVYCGEKNGFKAISKNKQKFIAALKRVDLNPREFLFDEVFKIFGMKDFNLDVLDIIENTKKEYDHALEQLAQTLASDVKEIFGTANSMVSAIRNWCDSLDDSTYSFIFSNNENRILELLKTATNDEQQMIQRMAKAVTSFRLEDWNSATIEQFLAALVAFKDVVEKHNNESKQSSSAGTDTYKITFVTENGELVEKTFKRSEYGRKAILLRNEIESALEDMGQSITEQEKRQVIMEILEKLC